MNKHLTTIPFRWNREFRTVRSHRIVIIFYIGWIFLERVRRIQIDGDAVSLQLPVTGYVYLIPTTNIEFDPVKFFRTILRFSNPVELPVAV